jgi:hypothetical protein
VTSRARSARALAEHLTDATGVLVTVSWDNPSGRPGKGTWRVEWTDGPTTTAMRALAAGHARFLAPLDIATLRWSRQYTPTAWAAALLTRAEHATLPDTPTEAVALVEYDLHDTDATAWTSTTLNAAADLARRTDGDPRQIAAALIAVGVTKPRNETPPPSSTTTRCPHCAKPLPTPAATGRPNRWCSPACRQAAHRQRTVVTKPRNETPCPTCGRPISTAATGRPARSCSPACRTRAWRTHPYNR